MGKVAPLPIEADPGGLEAQALILQAMDAALDAVRTKDGHHSGAYGLVWDALYPLCCRAYEARARVRNLQPGAGDAHGS